MCVVGQSKSGEKVAVVNSLLLWLCRVCVVFARRTCASFIATNAFLTGLAILYLFFTNTDVLIWFAGCTARRRERGGGELHWNERKNVIKCTGGCSSCLKYFILILSAIQGGCCCYGDDVDEEWRWLLVTYSEDMNNWIAQTTNELYRFTLTDVANIQHFPNM